MYPASVYLFPPYSYGDCLVPLGNTAQCPTQIVNIKKKLQPFPDEHVGHIQQMFY